MQTTLEPKVQSVSLMQEIQSMRSLAESLMKTKHYQQLGMDGIFGMVQSWVTKITRETQQIWQLLKKLRRVSF